MFAIIKASGHQYTVTEGDVVRIQKITGEAGDKVEFGEVLAVNDGKKVNVGSPLVEGAAVQAEILEQARDKKIVVFKKKRRQNYRRTAGHRQQRTVVRITGIAAK